MYPKLHFKNRIELMVCGGKQRLAGNCRQDGFKHRYSLLDSRGNAAPDIVKGGIALIRIKPPDIFSQTLLIRVSLSARLLLKGTSGSSMNLKEIFKK
jgi:hypothetical protein